MEEGASFSVPPVSIVAPVGPEEVGGSRSYISKDTLSCYRERFSIPSGFELVVPEEHEFVEMVKSDDRFD